MLTFNLIDQPWIPCATLDGRSASLGVLETLTRASELREIADTSPIVTAALHRFLLAILHHEFGPASAETWAEMWREGRWDAARLAGYLDQRRSQFDLFDDRRPFYQVSSLSFEYAVPIVRRYQEVASNANSTLFDHTPDYGGSGISPAEAARLLVGHHGFAVGGLVSLQRHEDPKTYKSANAGPLNKGAVMLMRGESLFETLMLNLHVYSPEDGEPFECAGDDVPAWDRPGETCAEDRLPAGYLDLLTWQSRRIRLEPRLTEDGQIRLHRAVIMKGFQFKPGFERHGHETMLAFVKREKPPKGQEAWASVTFREERALWRDSLALFQSVENTRARPKVVQWMSDVMGLGYLPRDPLLQIDTYGLSTDQAKVEFWRHERLSVPLAYLSSRPLQEALGEALTRTERAAMDLRSSIRNLVTLRLAPDSDGSPEKQPKKEVVANALQRLAPERTFWPALEAPFRAFLIALAEDRLEDNGGEVYGRAELPRWAAQLRRAGWAAFRHATDGLDTSARSLKGLAIAERDFAGRLGRALGDLLARPSQGGET